MFRNHPYGRVFPTEEMMNGYQIDAVKSFYRSNFGACRTHVYVVGRFDENEIKIAISRFFGNWLAGKVSQVNVPHPVSQKAIHLIHRPDAVQSSIAVGLPVIDPSHEDHLSLILANALLGGATISRITQNIREDKGYTYNAYSEISTRYRNAYWVQTADVATEVTGAALQEIVHEIKRLSAESPPEEEVNKIKNFVSGLFVLRNSSPGGIISQLALLDLHGLDEDYLTSYVRNVHQVTPRDIQRVTIAYLKNDKMLIIVAGDREKICDQLLPFGLVIDR
jgi:predicted Zn-dependent peptidase